MGRFVSLVLLVVALVIGAMASVPQADAVATADSPGSPVQGFRVQALPVTLSDGELAADAAGRIHVAAVDGATSPAGLQVLRYDDKGVLDPNWAAGGTYTRAFDPAADDVIGIAVAPSGSVLVAGTSGADNWVVKLDSTGAVDTGFGVDGDGRATVTLPCAPAHSMTVDSSGAVWLVNLSDAEGCTGSDYRKLDGVTGAVTGLSANHTADFALDIEADPAGVLLLSTNAAKTATVVTRLTSSGAADGSFGAGGTVTASARMAPQWHPDAGELHVDDGGTVTAAFHPVDDPAPQECTVTGSVCLANADVEIIRLSSSGSPETEFGTDGHAHLDLNIKTAPDGPGQLDIDVTAHDAHVYVGYNTPAQAGSRGKIQALRVEDGQVDIGFRDGGTLATRDPLVSMVPTTAGAELATLGEGQQIRISAWQYATGQGLCDGNITTILGTEGDDIIEGTDGVDIILAGPGNDTIDGLGGDDVLCGGAGDDVINGGDGADEMFGEDGNDALDGGNGADTGSGGAGADDLSGGGDNDVLTGDQGGDDLAGGAGDDVLNGSDGVDNLWGDAGHDTLNGGEGVDHLRGGGGNDTLNGAGGDDSLFGETGNDTLNGGAGADLLDGGIGVDKLNGGDGNDTLSGRDGNDTMNGDGGNDTLYGAAGNDTLNGGAGIDFVSGDAGDDTVNGNAGSDTVNGGDGVDKLNGGDGVDKLNGGAGADTVHGNNGSDTVNGNDGADKLYGDGGADKLNGGPGKDTCTGGAGTDTGVACETKVSIP